MCLISPDVPFNYLCTLGSPSSGEQTTVDDTDDDETTDNEQGQSQQAEEDDLILLPNLSEQPRSFGKSVYRMNC